MKNLIFNVNAIPDLWFSRKPPAEPPTINNVLRRLASLGGFLVRKGDGELGVETIWQ